jgi:hypothetical protein
MEQGVWRFEQTQNVNTLCKKYYLYTNYATAWNSEIAVYKFNVDRIYI